MIYVLIGAAVLTAVMGNYVDTIVIAAEVLINALIGYLQEDKAADALEGTRTCSPWMRRPGRDHRRTPYRPRPGLPAQAPANPQHTRQDTGPRPVSEPTQKSLSRDRSVNHVATQDKGGGCGI